MKAMSLRIRMQDTVGLPDAERLQSAGDAGSASATRVATPRAHLMSQGRALRVIIAVSLSEKLGVLPSWHGLSDLFRPSRACLQQKTWITATSPAMTVCEFKRRRSAGARLSILGGATASS